MYNVYFRRLYIAEFEYIEDNLVWIKLIICCGIIMFAGTKLARYGDAISEKTGMGRLWVGMILIALVTSLPEMVTGISSAVIVGQPDLALGNFWGSCMFNLAILGVLDVMNRNGPVLSSASYRNIQPALMGILLIMIAGGSLIAGDSVTSLSVGWLGIMSIVIFGVYLIGIRQMFIYNKKHPDDNQEQVMLYIDLSKQKVIIGFGLAALAIIGGGIWLSYIGDEIASTYNLSASFVGSLFLAIGTSLPEIVVAITAIRIGAIDLAVGDILGANMLNTANIFTTDIFYSRGPLLNAVSIDNVFIALAVILMSLTVVAGLKFKKKHKTFGFISWNAALILLIYLSTMVALFYY